MSLHVTAGGGLALLGRDPPHRREPGQLFDGRGGRARARAGAEPVDRADPDRALHRRLHQVGAVPISLLAAERDAGAHARLGVPALGDDGEAGRLPAGALRARDRRRARRTRHAHRGRPRHHAGRRVPGAARRELQGRARLLDGGLARDPGHARGPRRADGERRDGRLHPRPRALQGDAVLLRRDRAARDRPEPSCA